VVEVVFVTLGVHGGDVGDEEVGDQVLEAVVDLLGAERVGLVGLEVVPEVLGALDGVLLAQVAEALDFGEGIEGRAGGVVLGDGALDGGEEVGVDAPTGGGAGLLPAPLPVARLTSGWVAGLRELLGCWPGAFADRG
jgi:hypothetical protein